MSTEKSITISTKEILKRLKKDDTVTISDIISKMLTEALPCIEK